jgi:hypothetical protein
MKPTSFFDLPWVLQEILLWEIDNLDYDSYESSRAQCIHEISAGFVSSNNKYIIDNFYKNVSVDKLQHISASSKESLQRSIDELNKIIS